MVHKTGPFVSGAEDDWFLTTKEFSVEFNIPIYLVLKVMRIIPHIGTKHYRARVSDFRAGLLYLLYGDNGNNGEDPGATPA